MKNLSPMITRLIIEIMDSMKPNIHHATQTGRLSQDLLNTAIVNQPCKHGKLPLHHAIQYGQLDSARLLLFAGADIHGVDQRGWTALHYAADRNDTELTKLLLLNGACRVRPDHYGLTPSEIARKRKHTGTLALLCQP